MKLCLFCCPFLIGIKAQNYFLLPFVTKWMNYMDDVIILSRLSVYLRLLVLKIKLTFCFKMEVIESQKHGSNQYLMYFY